MFEENSCIICSKSHDDCQVVMLGVFKSLRTDNVTIDHTTFVNEFDRKQRGFKPLIFYIFRKHMKKAERACQHIQIRKEFKQRLEISDDQLDERCARLFAFKEKIEASISTVNHIVMLAAEYLQEDPQEDKENLKEWQNHR